MQPVQPGFLKFYMYLEIISTNKVNIQVIVVQATITTLFVSHYQIPSQEKAEE